MKRIIGLISLLLLASATFTYLYFQDTHEEPTSKSLAAKTPPPLLQQPAGTNVVTPIPAVSQDILGPLSLKMPNQEKWWHDAVMYQIWPRSFNDTNADGSGDIKGITQKLDYLHELGVTAIWLNPIFESNSYHGYDTTDYYQIEKDLGSMSDFEELIATAKLKGIKVILDLALNHVSNDHPWFIKSANKESGYEDFFVWSKTLPEGYGKAWSNVVDSKAVWHYVGDEKTWKTKQTRKDWYYGTFGFGQPDLNFKNPVVVREIEKVAKFWLDKGVDGFRLDAIRYIIEEGGIPLQADTASTIQFWKNLSTYIKKINSEAFLIGESFSDPTTAAKYFGNGDILDAAFDFGFGLNIVDALKATTNISTDDADAANLQYQRIRETLWGNIYHKTETTAPHYFFAKSLDNHDLDRLSNTLTNNEALSKIAGALLFTMPGIPFIYYGDEINMYQFRSGEDIYRRAPMQWNTQKNAGFSNATTTWVDDKKWLASAQTQASWWETSWNKFDKKTEYTVDTQEKNRDSTLNFYKQLIAIRNNDDVLKLPQKVLQYNNTGSVLIVKYSKAENDRWVIINLNSKDSTELVLPTDIKGNFQELISSNNLLLDKKITITAGQVLLLKPNGQKQ